MANRNVIKRVVDVVIYLRNKGLASRERRESLDELRVNKRNFLETLNYI